MEDDAGKQSCSLKTGLDSCSTGDCVSGVCNKPTVVADRATGTTTAAAAASSATQTATQALAPVTGAPRGNTKHTVFRGDVLYTCDVEFGNAYRKSNTGKYLAPKSEKERTGLLALLQLKKALDEVGLPFYLEGGSALGYIRNCGIIPGDPDTGTICTGLMALGGGWFYAFF